MPLSVKVRIARFVFQRVIRSAMRRRHDLRKAASCSPPGVKRHPRSMRAGGERSGHRALQLAAGPGFDRDAIGHGLRLVDEGLDQA